MSGPFCVWKRRFPCLYMELQHQPEKAAMITEVGAVLHDQACVVRDPQPPECLRVARLCSYTTRNSATRPPYMPPVDGQNDSLTGMQARQLLMQRSFS